VQLNLVRSGRPGPVTGGAASRNPGVLSENFIRSGIGLLRSNRRITTSDVFCPLGFRQLRR